MKTSKTGEDYDPLLTGDDFKTFIENVLADFRTPGLAVAVVHKDKTFSAGYGIADLDTREPVTPSTLFYTGSTTKSHIAALTAQLVASEEPKYKVITWSSRLADLIGPDFVLQDEYVTAHVTLADALSHRTGMPRHDMVWVNGDASLKGIVRSMRHLPLHHEFRTEYEYCNLMYAAVAYAIEIVTGQSIAEVLREWLWTPLGMGETTYALADAQAVIERSDGRVNLARGYYYDPDSISHVKVSWSSVPPSIGARCLYTP